MTFDPSIIGGWAMILAGVAIGPAIWGLSVSGAARDRKAWDTRRRFERLATGWPQVRTTPLPPSGGPAWMRFGPLPDEDILARVPRDSQAALALAAMKGADPTFSLDAFLPNATAAFVEILAGLASGCREQLRPQLAPAALAVFEEHLRDREAAGVTSVCEIHGIKRTSLRDARFEARTGQGQIAVTFIYDGVVDGRCPEGGGLSWSGRNETTCGITLVFTRNFLSGTPDWLISATDPTGFTLLDERRARRSGEDGSGGYDGGYGDGGSGDGGGDGGGGDGGGGGGCD